MPPSGPTLWSSNNSIQLNSAQENNGQHNTKNMINNTEDDDVIDSLGKVLSSVNLAGEVDGSAHSSASSGGGGQGQQGGYGAPGTAIGSQNGSWKGLSGSSTQAPAPGG